MLKRSKFINITNSAILIVFGMANYFLAPNLPLESLFNPASGLILLALSGQIKKQNDLTIHTILAIIFLNVIWLFFHNSLLEPSLSLNSIFVAVMELSCLTTLMFFVSGIIKGKDEKYQ